MPRLGQQAAVAERTEPRLAEQRRRRQEEAHRGRTHVDSGAKCSPPRHSLQPTAESPTQARVARRLRPRAQGGVLTVAIRGHFADRTRALSEGTGMSLAKLLQDAVLAYGGEMDAGYEPGTELAEWTAR